MGASEEMVPVLVTQNDIVPNEWKDRWWLKRGHRFSNLDQVLVSHILIFWWSNEFILCATSRELKLSKDVLYIYIYE